MSTPPTLVFVTGSWHKPSCYDKIIKLLESEHDLRCEKVTLPSTSGDPAATFKDDIDAARAVISKETRSGRNVIVIAHSYGGMVGNSAVKGFTKTTYHPQPKSSSISPKASSTSENNESSETEPNNQAKGFVIGIILIASGYTLTGVAFMDFFFGHPPPQWVANRTTGFADIVVDPRQFFYHDVVPDSEAEYWVSQLTTQSLKSLFEGGEYAYAGWLDVPSWYIGTVQDQGLPVLAQRLIVGMARGLGGDVTHRELDSSHSPFLSQPGNTVDVIVEAVGDLLMRDGAAAARGPQGSDIQVSGGIRNTGVDAKKEGPVLLPAARIMSPVSWFKFGVPLAFGRFLGWGISIWSWSKRTFVGGSR